LLGSPLIQKKVEIGLRKHKHGENFQEKSEEEGKNSKKK
jgi:hypothetical protein